MHIWKPLYNTSCMQSALYQPPGFWCGGMKRQQPLGTGRLLVSEGCQVQQWLKLLPHIAMENILSLRKSRKKWSFSILWRMVYQGDSWGNICFHPSNSYSVPETSAWSRPTFPVKVQVEWRNSPQRVLAHLLRAYTRGLRDLSSPTRDWSCALCSGSLES